MPLRPSVGITRFDRVVIAALTVLLAAAAGVVWLSQWMVAPPRPRVSESERPVLGLVLRDRPGDGVEVVRAVPPARTAGLRPGDRIERVDDRPLRDAAELTRRVAEAGPGTRLTIRASRPGDGGARGLVLVDVEPVPRRVSPADEDLPFEEVEIPGRNGVVLRGWYVPPPVERGRAPAVAYGHGNASDRRDWLPYARAVHDAGLGQLLFDFGGRGESDGDVISLGAHEAADLRAALEWLALRPEVDPNALALAGRSMGAAAAILAAADDSRVRALVLDSPFADLRTEADRAFAERHLPAGILRPLVFAVAGWRAGFDPDAVRPVEAIARVRAPALLLHGTLDGVVPIADAEAIRAAAAAPVTFLPLEGLGHNDPRPPVIRERVAEYLARTLR